MGVGVFAGTPLVTVGRGVVGGRREDVGVGVGGKVARREFT